MAKKVFGLVVWSALYAWEAIYSIYTWFTWTPFSLIITFPVLILICIVVISIDWTVFRKVFGYKFVIIMELLFVMMNILSNKLYF